MINISIIFIILVVDTTTMPRETIKPRPTPRPRYATPLRLTIIHKINKTDPPASPYNSINDAHGGE
jgi:hypothetical protein